MTYDIIIIGASFSGLTLAHHLPKELKVLILDHKKKIDAHLESTGLITQATYDLLADFVDVKPFIPNQIKSIGVIGTDYKRNFFSYTDDPWIYSTDTPNLVKKISETLPENIKLKLNSKFLNYQTNTDTDYPVEIIYSERGKEKKIKAKFIVGADGAKSSVAQCNSKLSKNTKVLLGLEKVFYGDITFGSHPEEAVYHYWFGDFSLGYGGWLSPTMINGKKAFRLGLAKLEKNVDRFRKIDCFVKKLQEEKMIQIEKGTKELLTFASAIPIGGPLKNVYTEHALLLGDAAGLCGAFAADGIKGAVISGKVAAKLLPRYLNGDKKALKQFYPEIQKYGKLMTYYKKQKFYRMLWNLMQRNRTFDAMFAIIAKSKEDFLHQFCDSKDRNKSLLRVVLKISNLPLLFKYAWFLFFDLFFSKKNN